MKNGTNHNTTITYTTKDRISQTFLYNGTVDGLIFQAWNPYHRRVKVYHDRQPGEGYMSPEQEKAVRDAVRELI